MVSTNKQYIDYTYRYGNTQNNTQRLSENFPSQLDFQSNPVLGALVPPARPMILVVVESEQDNEASRTRVSCHEWLSSQHMDSVYF